MELVEESSRMLHQYTLPTAAVDARRVKSFCWSSGSVPYLFAIECDDGSIRLCYISPHFTMGRESWYKWTRAVVKDGGEHLLAKICSIPPISQLEDKFWLSERRI